MKHSHNNYALEKFKLTRPKNAPTKELALSHVCKQQNVPLCNKIQWHPLCYNYKTITGWQ
jgi:hypothetical protein